MSASAIVALRKAIRARLIDDSALMAMLGGMRIFDEAPRGTQPPYVTFGDASARDWSTNTDRGVEHFVVIEVWSEQRGEREALSIAARVQDLLDDATLALEDHRLVNLRYARLETRRENQGRFARASLRFRAVTETL